MNNYFPIFKEFDDLLTPEEIEELYQYVSSNSSLIILT